MCGDLFMRNATKNFQLSLKDSDSINRRTLSISGPVAPIKSNRGPPIFLTTCEKARSRTSWPLIATKAPTLTMVVFLHPPRKLPVAITFS